MRHSDVSEVADNNNDDGRQDEDYENVAVEKLESWFIFAHVYDKVINISCGDASQRVKWLAHVAVARWDESGYQGWKRLGIPTAARLHHKDGEELDMNSNIRDVLHQGDHIYVETSIPPTLIK